jgi:flotillin
VRPRQRRRGPGVWLRRSPRRRRVWREAEAIKARSAALAENQEAVIAQQLAENWPEIVRAGAQAFAGVDHMVVLNGAQGVSEMLAKALTMGGTGLGPARQLLDSLKQEAVGGDAKRVADGAQRASARIDIK